MGNNEEALEDAEESIRRDPKWIKGYHRKACAHRGMGQGGLALDAYLQAAKVEPDNRWVQDQIRQAKEQVIQDSKDTAVTTVEEWLTVFECIPDSRERLCTLAHFWNHCGRDERYKIFGRFLILIAGKGSDQVQHTGVKHEDFTTEMMVPLPMDNYQDLDPVENWMLFFSSLNKVDKVNVFEKMWMATNEAEKDVIVNDLRHFFLEPSLEARFGEDEDDEDEEEDGDEEGAATSDGTAIKAVVGSALSGSLLEETEDPAQNLE
ncbi:unnamed protein product [Choristocarpus tenellus]